MLTHLFKLIWNKKKQNLLLIIEIFVSFIVLFVIFSFLSYAYENYKSPVGFEPDNIRVANIHLGNENSIFSDSITGYHELIKNGLQSMPGVKGVAFSDFSVPYIMGSHTSNIKYKDKQISSDLYFKDDTYANVMGMKMESGRWFNKTDEDTTKNTAVINEYLKEKLFGKEDAVGKQITGINSDDQKWNIVGVVKNTKSRSDYLPANEGLYLRMNENLRKATTTILVKADANAGAEFDSRLSKTLSGIVKNANIEITSLNENRKTKNLIVLVPSIIFAIIFGFLIFNVCLGLFGVLWYNINKRKAEIGLRKAIGASSNSIMRHYVGEAWVLASLSIIIGVFFAAQFPLLRVFDLDPFIYIKGIIFSIIFIYFIVFLCAVYPSRLAAAVYPARVLHEE